MFACYVVDTASNIEEKIKAKTSTIKIDWYLMRYFSTNIFVGEKMGTFNYKKNSNVHCVT